MISQETRDKWHRQLNTIQGARQRNLLTVNDWEASFIDSVFDTMQKNNGDLSFKQSSVLARIYNRIE